MLASVHGYGANETKEALALLALQSKHADARLPLATSRVASWTIQTSEQSVCYRPATAARRMPGGRLGKPSKGFVNARSSMGLSPRRFAFSAPRHAMMNCSLSAILTPSFASIEILAFIDLGSYFVLATNPAATRPVPQINPLASQFAPVCLQMNESVVRLQFQ